MSRRLLVGFDFGGTKVAVVLADLEGTVVASQVIPTFADRGAEQVVERALRTAYQMLPGGAETVAAVGVATMGITREECVELAPNVPGWDRLALPEMMRSAFEGAPVSLANDVKAAALAELTWGELHGVDVGIYLNLGTGIAAALIVGGAVLEGAHGAAGEIGYWARSRADGGGVRGGRAPLEEYAGGAGARIRALTELGVDGGVAALADAPGAAAEAFLRDLYEEIALHAANLVIAVDPERVVVGGGYARGASGRGHEPDAGAGDLAEEGAGAYTGGAVGLLPTLARRLDEFVPYPPELVLARFGADAGSAGAVALALNRFRELGPA